MSALWFQIAIIVVEILTFLFIASYHLLVRRKEKEFDKKQSKIDADYHHIVDNALAKERKILDDATTEAQTIITGAQYINQASKDTVNQALQKMVSDIQSETVDTRKIVDESLQKMVSDIHSEAQAATGSFLESYKTSLNQLANESLNDLKNITNDTDINLKKSLNEFQTIAKSTEIDLQKQIQSFKDTLLADIQKELEAYKQSQLQKADQSINAVVKKASAEVLNKTITLEDHQNLVIEALEKAKREGMLS